MSNFAITPAQMLAARGLLGWPRDRLAARLGIIPEHVGKFERIGFISAKLDLGLARAALEAAGVEFIAENVGGGVRLRKAAK